MATYKSALSLSLELINHSPVDPEINDEEVVDQGQHAPALGCRLVRPAGCVAKVKYKKILRLWLPERVCERVCYVDSRVGGADPE